MFCGPIQNATKLRISSPEPPEMQTFNKIDAMNSWNMRKTSLNEMSNHFIKFWYLKILLPQPSNSDNWENPSEFHCEHTQQFSEKLDSLLIPQKGKNVSSLSCSSHCANFWREKNDSFGVFFTLFLPIHPFDTYKNNLGTKKIRPGLDFSAVVEAQTFCRNSGRVATAYSTDKYNYENKSQLRLPPQWVTARNKSDVKKSDTVWPSWNKYGPLLTWWTKSLHICLPEI